MPIQPRVGLLATLLSTAMTYRGAGIHTYSRQLLHHLPSQAGNYDYLAFVSDSRYRPTSDLTLHPAPFAARNTYARILWEQTVLPVAIRRQRLSLLHGFAYATPLATSLPRVVTVHDLSFLHFPQAFRPGNRLYLSRITAISCRRAHRVIAVSEATAVDLQRMFEIPPAKIDVVPNGVDEVYRPLSPSDVAVYRVRAGWPERFILMVGTLEPRKNHVVLLEAYAGYRRRSSSPLPLLIGGGKGWHYDAIFERVTALGLQDHVHFLGFVPDAAMPWLYNAATLFVYPSRYEGFGLPVAEAMACGAPTITSTASSLPEVAGTAAVTIDPDDVEALAQAMADILAEPARLAEMKALGLSQVRRFRWNVAAAETGAVYDRALEASRV